MKIKLDENLSKSLAHYLSGLGYDVATVVDQQLSGISDPVLWQEVCAEDKFLVTADLNFSDLRKLSTDHPRRFDTPHPPTKQGQHAPIL